MIITDYNKMTLEELLAINIVLGKEYLIEDGKITNVFDTKKRDI